jgi:hypothetical protein
MFLKQVANDSTGCVSYVGYCYSCKAGFVIDPLEDIEPYLQVAKDSGIRYHLNVAAETAESPSNSTSGQSTM